MKARVRVDQHNRGRMIDGIGIPGLVRGYEVGHAEWLGQVRQFRRFAGCALEFFIEILDVLATLEVTASCHEVSG